MQTKCPMLCSLILLLAFGPVRPTDADPAPGGVIDTLQPGWIWNGMVQFDDPSFASGTARAGGPGSYGAFTFNGDSLEVHCMEGTTVTVDGRTHRIGKIKVSLDGSVKATVSLNSTDTNYDICIYTAQNLSKGNHVLQLDPGGGWAVINYIKVASKNTPSPSSSPATAGSTQADPGSVPEDDYQLIPASAPIKCLDVYERWDGPGAPTQIYPSNMGQRQPNQIIHVSWVGGGYRLTPLSRPTRALTCIPPSNDGAHPMVVAWEFSGLPAQIWTITPMDNGAFRLSPSNDSHLALTVIEGTTNDPLVGLDTWRSWPSQIWALRRK